jgi:hypothetical protein
VPAAVNRDTDWTESAVFELRGRRVEPSLVRVVIRSLELAFSLLRSTSGVHSCA